MPSQLGNSLDTNRKYVSSGRSCSCGYGVSIFGGVDCQLYAWPPGTQKNEAYDSTAKRRAKGCDLTKHYQTFPQCLTILLLLRGCDLVYNKSVVFFSFLTVPDMFLISQTCDNSNVVVFCFLCSRTKLCVKKYTSIL